MTSAKQGSEIATRLGAISYVECSSLSGDGMEDLSSEIISAAKRTWETKCTKQTKCCNCNILWWRGTQWRQVVKEFESVW